MDYYRQCYYNIRQRCRNPNHKQWKNYGGRGITCYWTSMKQFRQWILDNLGERPEGLTLDRIDNNGNYEPGNLRWATYGEQMLNNSRMPSSGYKYVRLQRPGCYVAQVGYQYVGCSPCPASAYLKALAYKSFLR